MSYGPAMAALKTDLQRAFVTYRIQFPNCSDAEAARHAGYGGNDNSLRRTAYKLVHDPQVQRAMQEEGWRILGDAAVQSIEIVKQIAFDPKNTIAERLKAAQIIIDRGGFAVVHQSKVTHETVDMSSKAVMERLRAAAAKLNRPLAELLGPNVIDVTPALVEKEKAEVKAEVEKEIDLFLEAVKKE